MAVANGLLVQSLLEAGYEVDFFSKPSFVDPRPLIGARAGFRFVAVVNRWSDGWRRLVGNAPVIRGIAGRIDAAGYNRKLVRAIRREHRIRYYDSVLWLGDYAHGRVPGVPAVSFAQGPPGTDARAVLARRDEIRTLAGTLQASKWTALAQIRLSRAGLPALQNSDHIIVGSQQSRRVLQERYGINQSRLSAIPYPLDLDLFEPDSREPERNCYDSALRVLWLGRIVPRKRLDLFLNGAALAIRQGNDVRLSVVGGVGFVRGYERLIAEFPFPERLEWVKAIPRIEVPALLRRHDVLAQPSDEENFGSSVAEAQACGLPVIVGQTNGNADYLCSRDIQLRDDRVETFAAALSEMAARKAEGRWGVSSESRELAEKTFALERVGAQLTETLELASRGARAVAIAE